MEFSVPDECKWTERDAMTVYRQIVLPVRSEKSEHTKLSVQ